MNFSPDVTDYSSIFLFAFYNGSTTQNERRNVLCPVPEDITAAPVVAEEWAAPAPEVVCTEVPVPVLEVLAECTITVIVPRLRPHITAAIIITPIMAATIIAPITAADAAAAAFPYWL